MRHPLVKAGLSLGPLNWIRGAAAHPGLASCATSDAFAVGTCNRRPAAMRRSRNARTQLSETSKFGARRGDRREKTRVELKWLLWTRTCSVI